MFANLRIASSIGRRLIPALLLCCGWWSASLLFGADPNVTGPSLGRPAAAPPFTPVEDPAVPPASTMTAGPPVTTGSQIQVTASENLLNRIAAQEQVVQGDVRQQMMGADVVGKQMTQTRTRVDLKPSAGKICAVLVLEGDIHSDTLGYTRPAVVNTLGRHHFQATKPIYLDATGFSTRKPVMTVEANNQTAGAQTVLSGRPVLGPIAEIIALSAAEQRRPFSEAIAREQIISRVLPEFNGRVDEQLADGNRAWDDKFVPALKSRGLLPAVQEWSSSQSRMFFSATLDKNATVNTAPPDAIAHDLTLALHESVLNSLIGRLNIAGTSISDRQARLSMIELRSRLEKAGLLLPQSETAADSGVEAAKVRFANKDPLRVRVDGDRIIVKLRARIEPVMIGALPELEITLPFKTEVREQHVVVKVVDVAVKPVDPKTPGWSAFQENLIRTLIESSIPHTELARLLPLPTPQPVSLKLAQFSAREGWLSLGYDAVTTQPQSQGPPDLTTIRARTTK